MYEFFVAFGCISINTKVDLQRKKGKKLQLANGSVTYLQLNYESVTTKGSMNPYSTWNPNKHLHYQTIIDGY